MHCRLNQKLVLCAPDAAQGHTHDTVQWLVKRGSCHTHDQEMGLSCIKETLYLSKSKSSSGLLRHPHKRSLKDVQRPPSSLGSGDR